VFYRNIWISEAGAAVRSKAKAPSLRQGRNLAARPDRMALINGRGLPPAYRESFAALSGAGNAPATPAAGFYLYPVPGGTAGVLHSRRASNDF
jgi:hypothetical protein